MGTNRNIKNICIPLNLYSKHIPSKLKEREGDYLLFGHYDSLEIGQNLFQTNCSFNELWKYAVDNADMDGNERNYSKQILYALRSTEKDDEYNDYNEFWLSNNLPPFLFICILQVGNINNIYDCRALLKRDVIDYYKERVGDDDIEVKCYSSLENNCIILAFRCGNFAIGLDIINKYHNEESALISDGNNTINIHYTYTTIGFKTSFDYNRLQDKLSRVNLYVIEKTPGSSALLYSRLCDKLTDTSTNKLCARIDKKQIIGNDDEIWEISDIPWNKFLDLYLNQEENERILSSGSVICERYTYSIVTHFINKHDENIAKETKESRKHSNRCQTIYKILSEFYKIHEKNVSEMVAVKRKGYYKSLIYIINSLEKFEYAFNLEEHFNDYTYFMLYNPLISMTEALLMATKLENVGINVRDMLPSKNIYGFLNSINSIVHHTTHSDRQFTQTPDFNAIIFETPAKLGAFYGALINLETQLLRNNDSLVDHQFLIVPGLREYINVEDVFTNLLKNKRLCMIEIPEQQMFEPEYTIPVLMHEIAHKIGSEIRLRDERRSLLILLIARMIATDLTAYALRCRDDNEEFIEKEADSIFKFSQHIYSGLFDKLIEVEERTCSEHLGDFNIEFTYDDINKDELVIKKDNLNTLNFEENMGMAVDELLNGIMNDQVIMNYIDNISGMRYRRDELIERLSSFIFFYTNNRIYEPNDDSINWVWSLFRTELHSLLHVFREVYADLISILILELDIEQYLRVITKNNFMIIEDSILESIETIRTAITVYTLIKKEVWESSAVDIRENDSDIMKKLKKRIAYFMLYAEGETPLSSIKMDAPALFRCRETWHEISKYMCKCIEKFKEISSETSEKKELMQTLKSQYDNIIALNIENGEDKKSIDDFLVEMENQIAGYKEQVYQSK